MSARLPIDEIRTELLELLESGPVVVSAPTGSGKSTQVPRWCPGPVLVVEPRRVACRTLADRVAHLEGTKVGARVGYHVRDDKRRSDKTAIVFMTPGIALLEFDRVGQYGTVILDEFHERSLDVDLLFSLLRRRTGRFVVMSATLQADRIAEALGGRHLSAGGRTFDVDVLYDKDGPAFPSSDRLSERVVRGLERLSNRKGDALVFLPGKGEIVRTASALGRRSDLEVVELHGGLSPQGQARAFQPASRPKVILSTNVAETSVTVPGVTKVIDGGLVRQTRYHQGRGALTLAAIARDSAEQRRGRAGRLEAGVCLRLWQPSAQLQDHTLPEIFRESLVPLVLAAQACGFDIDDLEFLDPPKAHAVASAKEELAALGALDADHALTDRGRRLFRLPLDPWLGRLLVEAEQQGTLDDIVDLVAVLAVDRPLFSDPGGMVDDEDPRSQGCDAVAAIRALRTDEDLGGHAKVLDEAHRYRRRLRQALGLSDAPASSKAKIDRRRIAQTALRADPRCAYLARHRKKQIAWANGGTEIALDKRSALQIVTRDGLTKLPEAMAVFGIRVLTDGPSTRIIATCATPLTLQDLNEARLGRPKLGPVRMQRRRVVADVEHVFAGRVLRTETVRPEGAMLREAFAELIARGSALKGAKVQIAERLADAQLLTKLAGAGLVETYGEDLDPLRDLPSDPPTWLLAVLEALGVEAPEDVDLVDVQDVLPPEIPEHLAERIRREYPRRVDLGDASYEVEYQPASRKAILHLVKGHRRSPPPRQYLPRFPGLTIQIQAGGTFHRL